MENYEIINQIFLNNVSMKINFHTSKYSDFDQLELWIRKATQNDKFVLNSIVVKNNHEIYLECILYLAKYLSQLSGIPLFEEFKRKILNQDKYKVTYQISILWQPHLDISLLKRIIDYCILIVKKFLVNGYKESEYELIDSKLNEFITHIRKLSYYKKSTFEILKFAYQQKIFFLHIGGGVYQIGVCKSLVLLHGSVSHNDSAIGRYLSSNKFFTLRILNDMGVPIPKSFLIKNISDAIKVTNKIEFPVVIKPIDQERGIGITTHIDTQEELKAAIYNAFKHTNQSVVILENQVLGECYRIFISKGKFLYAVRKNPVRLFGDGITTIKDLILKFIGDEKHKPIWQRSSITKIDDILIKCLKIQKLGLSDIPSNGKPFNLRLRESTEWGGFDEDVTDIIDKENINLCEKISDYFQIENVGIDLISKDISSPWNQNSAVVCDVNFSPLLGGGEISKSYLFKFFMGYDFHSVNFKISHSQNELMNNHYKSIENGVNSLYIDTHFAIDSRGMIKNFEQRINFLNSSIRNKNIEQLLVLIPNE